MVTLKGAGNKVNTTLIARRASDVRLRQDSHKQTGMVDDFEDFFQREKRVFLKHLWDKNFAYSPRISLRTCLSWLSLAWNSVVLHYYNLQRKIKNRGLKS